MEFVQLTEEQREEFEENGFFHHAVSAWRRYDSSID